MLRTLFSLLLILTVTPNAAAFCGFYVAKADASLYNQASQVVMARKDGKTVLSLMNDYQGELQDFALVVPVPQVLQQGQIHIGDAALFKHIDNFSAPRLVEYRDGDPCRPVVMYEMAAPSSAMLKGATRSLGGNSLGVTVEAEYTVGEYDIVILSAKESDGLETWLLDNGYKIPRGAGETLRPYIMQNMKFFVAKVNLAEQSKTGLKFLRPLQFAFESPKFMLPIRLGMINAKGPQELLVYVLTEKGRVEASNYPTVKLPSNRDIPAYVKDDFANFYKDLFDHQAQQRNLRAVFTEYFWNMGWCDPCAAEPLTPMELKQLGVFWLDHGMTGGALPVQVTRLHLRYTNDSFPEDLMFQETGDNQNFQGRYVLRHAWQGDPQQCEAAKTYFKQLAERREQEARTLAELTGWDLDGIRAKMKLGGNGKETPDGQWWRKLW
ncbi:MAG: DUF2330 domain-containing protein [Gammaproteobacteria bacterium]